MNSEGELARVLKQQMRAQRGAPERLGAEACSVLPVDVAAACEVSRGRRERPRWFADGQCMKKVSPGAQSTLRWSQCSCAHSTRAGSEYAWSPEVTMSSRPILWEP